MFRKTIFTPGHYFHIYNRGIDKRKIFIDTNDYLRFSVLLYISNNKDSFKLRDFYTGQSCVEVSSIPRKETLISIGAYCLMPNHFHFLIKEKSEKGISAFIQKLSTAYAMYFNTKYQRSGSLFQGPFKAELANKDTYLKYLFAYIHLNPVKLINPLWKEKGIKDIDKTKKFLDNYRWSSYTAYIKNQENPILDKKEFPEYFNKDSDFSDFINDLLSFKK